MKKILILLIILPGLSQMQSCTKDTIEPVSYEINSIAEDLKKEIETEGVEALQICCLACNCSQTIGWGTDYSFSGNNFLRFRDTYYNLNELKEYRIETFSVSNESEIRMILFFD